MVFEFSLTWADLPVILTLILLEGVLSFDNAAVLAAMALRLPPEQRRKALLYGLIGAYVFRFAAIFLVFFIVEYPIFRILGGAYLVYLMADHLFSSRHADGEGKVVRKPPRIPGLSAFWATVVVIEMTDIAFALDQVVAAVALVGSDGNILLIIIASLFAILFLRVSAFYMTRLMEWFPALERLAYVAVGFVGIKLLVEVAHEAGYVGFEIPKWLSIVVTLSLIVVPVVIKAVVDWLRRQPERANRMF